MGGHPITAHERGRRQIYELLDLGYGRCTMVFATADRVNDRGEDPAAEALRRLGAMRVATKYPHIAARHLEETGRQGEIVEVKGSVELAPLTGLADAIVDLTATGTTLRENGLVVREEIVECTARLIANPVAYKLKAAQIDQLLERMRAGASGVSTQTAPRGGRRTARARPGRRLRGVRPYARSSPTYARVETRPCSSTRAGWTPRERRHAS